MLQSDRRDFSRGAAADAKEVPRRPEGQAKAAEAKGRPGLGVVKDKPFDEAHSLGDDSDDVSTDESVMTNESQPKQQGRGGAAPASAASGMQAKAQGGAAS